jgi:hypothetical protein
MNEMTNYEEVEGIDTSTYAGKAAKAVKTKVRGIMGDDLLSFMLVDFVAFMMLNTEFASRGIFITDSNKEDCYIKIIESGDEGLINKLEKYLSLRDSIKKVEQHKADYSSVIEALQLLPDYNSVEAVNAIVEEYLRR